MTHTLGGVDAPTLTSKTMLPLSQACELLGKPGQPKDRKTLLKWIKEDGRYPNAVQEPDGRRGWMIPVQDLVDAGDLDPSQVCEVAATLEVLRESKQIAELRSQIAELETEVKRSAAIADERGNRIESLERMLEALIMAGGSR